MVKVLLIGLDGAPWDLLDPWIKEDRLPNLARLARKGVVMPLLSVLPMSSASAWSSIITGKYPNKHGIVDFMKRKEGTYDFVPVNSTFLNSKELWRIISEHGKKVCVINVPFSYPIREGNSNEIILSGMLTPSLDKLVHPFWLKDKIKSLGYRIDIEVAYSEGREEVFLKDLYDVTEKRFTTAMYLMEEYDWDFFMIVFIGTDRIQHFFWNHFENENSKYRNAIYDYYRKIDEYIGAFLHKIDDDTVVMILSDHGMGSLHRRFHLNNLLWKNGYIKMKSDIPILLKRIMYMFKMTPLNIYDFLSKVGLVKFHIIGEKQGFLQKLFLSLNDLDWSRTEAYSPLGFGQVNINLEGREPEGIVSKDDFEYVRQELVKLLQNYVDRTNNNNVIESVHIDQVPDIVVVPNSSYGIFTYGVFPTRAVMDFSTRQSGTHTLKGFLLISKQIKENINCANLVDIAPTILNIMDTEIPNDMDGRALC